MEQELLTLPEHLRSPPVFSGVRVTRSLVLYVCLLIVCFLLLLSVYYLPVSLSLFRNLKCIIFYFIVTFSAVISNVFLSEDVFILTALITSTLHAHPKYISGSGNLGDFVCFY